jgi:4-carboxymuconolactone decarboxylase
MSRLPVLDQRYLNIAQSEVFNRIATGARGGVTGPFLALLHSPVLAGLVEQLGIYLRFRSAVPERTRELAILVVARHWRCGYEWSAHAPLAERLGVSREALTRLGQGEAHGLGSENELEAIVILYCETLLGQGRVNDDLYDRTRGLLGDQGIVDLTGLLGYYSLLALTLNGHGIAPPAGAEIPWEKRS